MYICIYIHMCMCVCVYDIHEYFYEIDSSYTYAYTIVKIIYTCNMTHWYMWCDSLMYETWLIHIYDMTHGRMWHDSIKSVKRAAWMSHDTHENVYTIQIWISCTQHAQADRIAELEDRLQVRDFFKCVMTHSYGSFDMTFSYLSWLIQVLTNEPYLWVMTHMKKTCHTLWLRDMTLYITIRTSCTLEIESRYQFLSNEPCEWADT